MSGLCSLVPAFPLLWIRYSFWGNILLTCGENSVKIPGTEFQSEYYSSSMQGQKCSLVLQTVTKLHNKLLSCVCQEMLDALSHQTNFTTGTFAAETPHLYSECRYPFLAVVLTLISRVNTFRVLILKKGS